MVNYRFSNLLGSTYRGGGVAFAGEEGNALVSPVGARVSIVDLLQNRTFEKILNLFLNYRTWFSKGKNHIDIGKTKISKFWDLVANFKI